jgi:hypothetical protein
LKANINRSKDLARLKNFVDQDERRNNFKKIEKIKKEKRSVRGRIIDDWIIDSPNSDLTKKEMKEKLDELYKKGLRRGRVIEVQKRNVFIAEENEEGLPEREKTFPTGT